jgi:hypothetical protein
MARARYPEFPRISRNFSLNRPLRTSNAEPRNPNQRWSSKLGPGCPVCRTPFDSIILSEGPLVKEDEAMPEIGPVAAAASLETQPPLLAWPQGDGAPTSVSGSMVYATNRERVQVIP